MSTLEDQITVEARPSDRCAVEYLVNLLHKEIPPIEWIVPDLLPPGLILLGGKSKTGKSWFALNLCLAIAEGHLAFRSFQCSPKGVLYLALEDPERRVQYRANKLLETHDISKNLMIATKWPRFAAPNDKSAGVDGFVELQKTLIEYSDIRCVVIDTWQKIRPSKRGYRSDYESDYAHLEQIQEMAQQHNCAIMLVHHARKDNAGAEKQDSLLGSTAIAGAADLIWILDRKHNESEGILTPSGRDIEDETPIVLSFDTGTWGYLGTKSDIDHTENQKAVLEALKNSIIPLSFSGITKASGVKSGSIGRVIDALISQGLLEKLSNGKYKLLESMQATKDVSLFVESMQAKREETLIN